MKQNSESNKSKRTAAAADYKTVSNRATFERSSQINQYIDTTSDDNNTDDLNQSNRTASGGAGSVRWHQVRNGASSPRQNTTQHSHRNTLAKVRPDEKESNRFKQLDQANRSLDRSEQEIDLHLTDEEKQSAELEEVYLCNCCGITKELEPAMKYIHPFRSLFYLFNFLSFTFAFALLGFGLWYRIDPKVYELHKYIETQNFTIAGWIMLFGGFIAILLTLEGCRGASKKSVRSLLLYCIIMTTLTIAFIGSLVLLIVHGLGVRLERFMSKEIYDQIRQRAMNTELNSEESPTQFLDFVQVKLRCCGAVDFRDYQKLGMVLPATCYTIPSNFIQAPGCAEAIRRMFDLRAGLAAGFTAASIVSQLLAVVFASLIVCSIYNYRATPKPASSTTI